MSRRAADSDVLPGTTPWNKHISRSAYCTVSCVNCRRELSLCVLTGHSTTDMPPWEVTSHQTGAAAFAEWSCAKCYDKVHLAASCTTNCWQCGVKKCTRTFDVVFVNFNFKVQSYLCGDEKCWKKQMELTKDIEIANKPK